MLYCANIQFGNEKVYPVVLMAKIIANGTPVILTFEKIMSSPQYLGAVKENGMDVKIDTPEDVPVEEALPFLSYGTKVGQEEDWTPIFNWVTKNNATEDHPQLELLVQQLVARGGKLTLDEMKTFIRSINTLKSYRSGELRFHIVDSGTNFNNAGRTLPIVKNYNKSQGHMFEHIKDDTNITSFMSKPDDRFFIKIPEHTKMTFPDPGMEVSNLIPMYDDIIKPYPHPIYQTPYYENIAKLSPPQILSRLEIIAIQRGLRIQDLQPIPEIDHNLVKGYAENDTDGIQENELDYYNALIEYIKYDIARTFKDADVEQMFLQNKCSPNMIEYLRELVYAGLCINWMHTNKVPLNYAQWYYEGSDDDEEEETVFFHDFEATVTEDLKLRGAGGVEINVGRGILKKFVDGTVSLHNFIEAASAGGLGLESYVQAIIKLFRWGHNKPQALKIGNYDKYFDLNTFTVKSTLGDLSSLQPTATANGYEMTAIGYIKLQDKFDDAVYLSDQDHPEADIKVPFGLICERPLVGGKSQVVFVSFFDILNKYKDNPEAKFIDGINLVRGESGISFSVDLNLISFTQHASLTALPGLVKESTDREYVFYDSDVVRKILLQFSEGPLSSLLVLAEVSSSSNILSRSVEQMSFRTEEEMYDKMMQFPASKSMYLKVGMAAEYMPVILFADKLIRNRLNISDVQVANLTQVLNSYLISAKEVGFVDEGFKWSEEGQAVPPKAPESINPNTDIRKMDSFAPAQQPTSQPTSIPVAEPVLAQASASVSVATPAELTLSDVKPFLRGYYIREIEVDKIGYQLEADGVVHGYIQMILIDGKNRAIVASKADIPDDLGAQRKLTSMNIMFLNQLMASAIAAMIEPADRGTYMYLHSEKTAIYFRQYFNQVWKMIASGANQ